MRWKHTDSDLFHQWEEAEARAEKWEKAVREERKRHEWEIGNLRSEFQQEMAKMRREMGAQIKGMAKEIEELKTENEKLREDNERLKSIINNDSNNSSNPPSRDQKPSKRANEYNNRGKSGKKRGGQIGHKGKTLTREEAEELIKSGRVEHEVIEINKKGNSKKEYISKFEYDIIVKTVVREYRYYADEAGKYNIPRLHSGDVRYGDELRTMAVALYSIGVMSINRIQELLNSMTGNVFKISEGVIYNIIRGFSEKIEPDINAIEADLMNQRVIQTDATVVTVDGVQSYVRNFSSQRSVLYAGMDRKNLEHLRKIPFLAHYTGTLIHDHETALYRFGSEHGECNVHVMRYLTKNTEDTGNAWSGEMKRLLSEMNRERKMLIAAGSQFTEAQIRDFEARYADIIRQGRAQNTSTRPKWAKKDELALLNRMEKYSENHLLFLHRFDVPFDNNMSERDLRKCKNRQKMSGGFGLSDGRNMACRILSFVESCKRRSLDVFDSIRSAFSNPVLVEG